MCKIKKEDLIGQIEYFPLEVVQRMVECQIEQNFKEDVSVFQVSKNAGKDDKGFVWYNTSEGFDFWNKVINLGFFDKFFEKYPKIDTHVYYRGVPERGDEILAELEKLGGKNTMEVTGDIPQFIYGLSPLTKTILSIGSDCEWAEFIKDTNTEMFLPEIIEAIEIDGKKYNKEDVISRIKELKEIC